MHVVIFYAIIIGGVCSSACEEVGVGIGVGSSRVGVRCSFSSDISIIGVGSSSVGMSCSVISDISIVGVGSSSVGVNKSLE